jgi:hypothetical protein
MAFQKFARTRTPVHLLHYLCGGDNMFSPMQLQRVALLDAVAPAVHCDYLQPRQLAASDV